MILAIPLPVFDPVLFSFQFSGFTLAIRWYALAYVVGFLIAWQWFVVMVRQPRLWPNEQPPLDSGQLEQLLTWIILGVIAGGRLGYAIFYNPAYFIEHPFEILKIWTGGMSFHGGFAGLILATYLYCKIKKASVANVADAISIVATPGLFFGRVANFINGELWGRPSGVPWAIIYQEGPAAICPEGWVGACSRHPSQLYEAALEGLLLCALLAWIAYRHGWMRYPGRITGLFFLSYGFGRFLVEFFRVPDRQFISESNPAGYVVRLTDSIGLTMGQSLTLPMIAIGLSVLVIFWRPKT